MAHARHWNPEVPVLGVARHFAKALGDGNDNREFLPHIILVICHFVPDLLDFEFFYHIHVIEEFISFISF